MNSSGLPNGPFREDNKIYQTAGCGSASNGCVISTGIANKGVENLELEGREEKSNESYEEERRSAHLDNTADHAGKINKTRTYQA